MSEPSRTHRSRIVVLGGGFAGIYTAMALEKAMDGRDDFEVVLVNKENYFVFQPMLPEVISGTIGMLDVVSPIRRLLPRTDLHVREVESVDLAAKVVTCSPGFRAQPHLVPFDHLVLALGSVTDFRGLRGLPEHAFPFKNLGDALNRMGVGYEFARQINPKIVFCSLTGYGADTEGQDKAMDTIIQALSGVMMTSGNMGWKTK